MPGRCSCAGSSCSCQIVAGNGLDISGTGNLSSPYTISIAPAQTIIEHTTVGSLDLSVLGGYASALVNLEANATTVTLPVNTARIDLLIVQGDAGSRTITWPAVVKFPGNISPVLSTPAASIDWITLIQAGGVWAGVLVGKALA